MNSVLLKKLKSALANGQKKSLQIDVSNVDRALGTILGSEITRQYPEGLSEDTFTIQLQRKWWTELWCFYSQRLDTGAYR